MTKAYVVDSAKAAAQFQDYSLPTLGLEEVRVAVSHCGICYSDIHLMDGDFGHVYPLIPGHEIVGQVVELGDQVKKFNLGDRVGIGWQRDSCAQCYECETEEENLCSSLEATCLGNPGGFGQVVQVHEHFAFTVPEEISSEHAGPLFCAGATVYSPLKRLGKSGDSVGVIGIGGLGHLAIQFAKALGYEVTAFSTSPQKESEARRFGADHFVVSKDEEAMKKYAKSQDLLLSTAHANLAWNDYLNILKPNGNLCLLGIIPDNVEFHSGLLVPTQKSISGSAIASPKMIEEMLNFAAKHKIVPQVEVYAESQLEEAVGRVRTNQARYRVVIQKDA